MAYYSKYRTKKGEIRHQAQIEINGKRISKSLKRFSDVQEWAEKEERRLKKLANGLAQPERYTVSQAVEYYFKEHLPTVKHQRAPKFILNWWRNEIGDRYLDTLTAPELIDLRLKVASEPKFGSVPGTVKHRPLFNANGSPILRSAKTVQEYMSYFSGLCEKAVREWAWIDVNPCWRINRLKFDNRRDRYLSDFFHLWPGEIKPIHWDDLTPRDRLKASRLFPRAYEFPRLVDALKSQRDTMARHYKSHWPYLLFVIQFVLGLRKSEATNMVWEENKQSRYPLVVADMTNRRLILKETKHDPKPRIKPINGSALKALLKLYAERHTASPLVFPRQDGQQPYRFQRRIYRAIGEAGLQDFVWHDIRHTTSSYLAMMGVNERERMAALHHKSITSQQRYTHLSPEHKEAIHSNLSSTILEDRNSPSRYWYDKAA